MDGVAGGYKSRAGASWQIRAEDYDARFMPYAGDPGGFNFKQFRSNVSYWFNP